MRILRAADRVASPWKNGQGVTREIAVYPEEASFDDFAWRISMAEVAVGGPFSHFAGVDRKLAVLQGRLALMVDGGLQVELDPASSALAFAGDAPVEARLPDGPVVDLNVMTRRGQVRSSMERVRIDAPLAIQDEGTTIVLTLTGRASAVCGTRVEELNRFDAVLWDSDPAQDLWVTAHPEAVVYIIRLTPDGAGQAARASA